MPDAPSPSADSAAGGAPLTSKARAALRAEGHALKPLLHVGKEGVTDAARRALDQAFARRELVKLRVLEMAPETARDTAEALASGPDTQVVQVAGRNALLYRPQPPAAPARAPAPTRRRNAPR